MIKFKQELVKSNHFKEKNHKSKRKKEKHSSLWGWFRIAWAHVHHSNQYNARFRTSKSKIWRMRWSIFKQIAHSTFIKTFLSTLKKNSKILKNKNGFKIRVFCFHLVTTESDGGLSAIWKALRVKTLYDRWKFENLSLILLETNCDQAKMSCLKYLMTGSEMK